MHSKVRNIVLSAGISLLTLTLGAFGQNGHPKATPTPNADENYTITSSIEIGVRGLSVDGSHEKYQSDLNYRPGIRIFDSSFNVEAKKDGFFDHALFQTSGWGGDPSGYFRGNVEKSGIYKFTSSVRRNRYYNNLINFAPTWSQPVSTFSQHRFNTLRDMGDFDLVLRPDSQTFRVRLGYSYNRNNGPGMYNIRWPSFTGITNPVGNPPATPSIRGEEYNVLTKFRGKADDLRAGVEGKLLGFNIGLNYGRRNFRDGTTFYMPTFNGGNDYSQTSGSSADFYERKYMSRGKTDFGNFFAQRTFANKFDFTGRLIYSVTRTNVNETDIGVGRTYASGTNPWYLFDNDTMGITGYVKRPQTRADIGFTYRATSKFRISETFSFDQFNGSGSNNFFETLLSRSGNTGLARNNDYSNVTNWRITSFHKYTNLIEADFDVNRKFSFNAGYRYTKRRVRLDGFTIATSGVATISPTEAEENHTNSGIFGMRIRPIRNWTLYADAEVGQADNVFTRAENSDYRFFRLRSITRFDKWTLNVSGIYRNNTNPGYSEVILGTINNVPNQVVFPAQQADANYRVTNISTSLDWTPNSRWNLSVGHTYDHQTSDVDSIVYVGAPLNSTSVCASSVSVPTNPCWKVGRSQYYVRDNFFFFDVTAHPVDRVTLFASYRIDDDKGQGSRMITRPEDMIYSYPLRFQTPEFKLSIKLNHRMDWDLGYKYYNYSESVPYSPFSYGSSSSTVNNTPVYPAQNYKAHMPYTSIRIYFGRSLDGRR